MPNKKSFVPSIVAVLLVFTTIVSFIILMGWHLSLIDGISYELKHKTRLDNMQILGFNDSSILLVNVRELEFEPTLLKINNNTCPLNPSKYRLGINAINLSACLESGYNDIFLTDGKNTYTYSTYR